MHPIKLLVLVCLAILVIAGASLTPASPLPARGAGTTIYVNLNATGSNNGTTWTDAYTSLQSALAAASSGDQIWIAQGTYYPSALEDAGDPRSATFTLKSGVAIYGGFLGGELVLEERDWSAHEVTLSGDLGVQGSRADNAYHVVSASGVDSTAVLDGVTITLGNADLVSDTDAKGRGGGLFNQGASPTLSHVIFYTNTAYLGGGMGSFSQSAPTLSHVSFTENGAGFGGGVYNQDASGLTVDDGLFVSNKVSKSGGAIYNYKDCLNTLNDITFQSNLAGVGGGGIFSYKASVAITDSTFISNTAVGSAGGLYNGAAQLLDGNGPSSARLTRVTFRGNHGKDGGGISNINSELKISSGQFLNNSAESCGGGLIDSGDYFNLSGTEIQDTNFDGNIANTFGGGIYYTGSRTRVTNTTFHQNKALTNSGGALALEIVSETGVFSNVVVIENQAALRGGGIYIIGGYPKLSGVSVISNTALMGGGLYTLDIPDCPQDFFCAWLNLDHMLFRGNTATLRGGGLFTQDVNVRLEQSALVGNTAPEGAGFAAVIFKPTLVSASLRNVTIQGNQAISSTGAGGGGLLLYSGSATLINTTVTGNSTASTTGAGGIGIESGANAVITNSLVAANTSAANLPDVKGVFTADAVKYSLFGALDGSTGITGGANGNKAGTLQNPLNPLLGPLTSSGSTLPYWLPQPGSPAIDTGSNADCLALDQRGLPRPKDGSGDRIAICDMGAIEVQSSVELIPSFLPVVQSFTGSAFLGPAR